MANLVLYRKYRPQVFSDIVGQGHIVLALTNQLKSGKVAHAYLFSGPRGLGKTTIARLIAKSLNCASPQKGEPDNECESCREITDGHSLDVIEIDAASNRGIDEIRDLRERIKYAPSKARFKVYIIDEVHMLTKEAFNALLKTIEEPPAHAVFILATTEVERIPETILSRVQRFDFRKISLQDIVSRLQKLADGEEVKIGKEALELIALNADGSMRDAESLIGKIISVEDKEITRKEVEQGLGLINIQAVSKLVDYLAARETAQAISYVNQLYEDGYDLQEFVKTLIGYLRNTLLLQLDRTMETVLASTLTDEQARSVKLHKTKFTPQGIDRMIRAFIAAGNEMKCSTLPQLPVELAIVELLEPEQPPKTQSV